MSNREVTERDADGNVTRLECYNAKDKLIYTHLSEWKDGRLVRKTSLDAGGAVTGSYDYAYDERGNNTEGTWFGYSDGVLMKAEFVYDDAGRVIEKTHIGKGTVATNKTFMTYDEEGRLVCSEYYGVWPDMAPVFTYREYDASGFVVRSVTEDAQHQLLHYELFRPNHFGKVAEYTSYDAQEKPVYTYKYYFDEEGNKTKTERYDGEGRLVMTSF